MSPNAQPNIKKIYIWMEKKWLNTLSYVRVSERIHGVSGSTISSRTEGK